MWFGAWIRATKSAAALVALANGSRNVPSQMASASFVLRAMSSAKVVDNAAAAAVTVSAGKTAISMSISNIGASSPSVDFKNYQKGRTVLAVAMSGGIDSAFTAYLMKNSGHNCVAVFMRNWDGSDEEGSEACTISENDYNDAQEVCNLLNIPLYDTNFTKEYWNQVFEPFLATYSDGMGTPNPDVFCNKYIKFDKLKQFVREKWGEDAVLATGHYATLLPGVDGSSPRQSLVTGIDTQKDQSYFLCMTKGSDFDNVVFPMGKWKKQDIKSITADLFRGLNVLKKKESMGICFIGKRSMKDFLGAYIHFSPGKFIDLETGDVLGEHDGKGLYTIGQIARISGMKSKYYVAEKRPDSNDVFVVPGHQNPLLYFSAVIVPCESFSWISGKFPDGRVGEEEERGGVFNPSTPLYCRVRHRGELYRCSVSIINPDYRNIDNRNAVQSNSISDRNTIDNNNSSSSSRSDICKGPLMRFSFGSPIWAVSPGQILALYRPFGSKSKANKEGGGRGEGSNEEEWECLGGGAILSSIR